MFRSFFIGGFECSTHRLRCGKRLDLVAATRHDQYAAADYRRLAEQGIRTAREGIRWHLIERTPGRYDFASALPLLRAARDAKIEVIWDLCHYGWPDDIDVFRPEFVRRFARLARAFAELHRDETDAVPYFVPINEMSFLSWMGAEVGAVNPFAEERGFELKCQLVRATIEAVEAVRDVAPRARIFSVEPTFNVVPALGRPEDAEAAEDYRQLQYQAWDMLTGRIWPQLGGDEKYLDVLGVNYYPWNQWLYAGPKHGGATIDRRHPGWRPLRSMLRETFERYERPLFIAETGCEDDARPRWLRHVANEARAALREGTPVDGICLYPIVNFPGWENERHCHNGLWDYADDHGHREIYAPLANELRLQQLLVERLRDGRAPRRDDTVELPVPADAV